MIELPRERLATIRPLFADYPYLHGLVHGILAGEFGQAFVDHISAPKAGMLCDDDFVFFGGDPTTKAAMEMVSSRPQGSTLIGPSTDWEQLIRHVWNKNLKIKQRVAFKPPRHWDRDRLRALTQSLPSGYVLKPITANDIRRFAQLSESLVELDLQTGLPSLNHGVGFGIEYSDQFVSGCSGFLAGGMLEFEVQTHPDHVRRGLATAVAAALIVYCLDYDIEPCWDAANELSAGLGTKLGFVTPTPYNAYILLQG
jgi:GNAT superfamily N-acetyltransferase